MNEYIIFTQLNYILSDYYYIHFTKFLDIFFKLANELYVFKILKNLFAVPFESITDQIFILFLNFILFCFNKCFFISNHVDIELLKFYFDQGITNENLENFKNIFGRSHELFNLIENRYLISLNTNMKLNYSKISNDVSEYRDYICKKYQICCNEFKSKCLENLENKVNINDFKITEIFIERYGEHIAILPTPPHCDFEILKDNIKIVIESFLLQDEYF